MTQKQYNKIEKYAKKRCITFDEALIESSLLYIETHEYPLFLEFFSKYHHPENKEEHEGLHIDFSKIDE